MRRTYALSLALLGIAFMLRVLGQALVAFFRVDFLPPMNQWYSGLIPYTLLLPIQLIILGLQAKISLDIWRGTGRLARCRPRAGRVLLGLSVVYFLAMVVRYALTIYLHPKRRWLTGTIPIIFHWVLAAYLFVLGRYYKSTACVAPANS
jgi:hypothetical protein